MYLLQKTHTIDKKLIDPDNIEQGFYYHIDFLDESIKILGVTLTFLSLNQRELDKVIDKIQDVNLYHKNKNQSKKEFLELSFNEKEWEDEYVSWKEYNLGDFIEIMMFEYDMNILYRINDQKILLIHPLFRPNRYPLLLEPGEFLKILIDWCKYIDDNQLNGNYEEYYPSGQIKLKAKFYKDQIDGISEGWYENNQIKFSHFSKMKKPDGIWQGWHENGQLKYYKEYSNGTPIGIWKGWYKSGKIEFEQSFDDVNRYRNSYYENGQMKSSSEFEGKHYKDGFSQNGWYENGKLMFSLRYIDQTLVERINYGINGNINNHEIRDSKERNFKKII